MATNKKASEKKNTLRISPVIFVICIAAPLILGLVIGLLIPTPGANIPYTPLNSVKVEDLTVNSATSEDPVVLRFKLDGLPGDTQLSLKVKHGEDVNYLDCTSDGSYFSCTVANLSVDPTHITLVLVHKGASVYLPLVRNLIQVDGSIGYLSVWDYQ